MSVKLEMDCASVNLTVLIKKQRPYHEESYLDAISLKFFAFKKFFFLL